MDALIFNKMKVKPVCTARVLFAPENYPKFEELNWVNDGQADFVQVFVERREHFEQRFSQAIEACKHDGVLWVSYPKSKGKKIYDINRDSLWGLFLAAGYHPVSQIALDEEWSALRVKRNQDGVIYEMPGTVKK
jgi:hypothetical protein